MISDYISKKKILTLIISTIFLLLIYINSYFLMGERLKWVILDLSPIWFEKIEIIIYEGNLVYFAIGMPEVELALQDEKLIAIYVGEEPIGIVTHASLTQGYHYYSTVKREFLDMRSIRLGDINTPVWSSLPTMSRSAYTWQRAVYSALLAL